MATLEEIDRHWTLDDVLDGNELLDAIDEAQQKTTRESERVGRRG